MLKVLIPMYYTFYSRFKTTFDKISWMIIYFIPVLVLIFTNYTLQFYWLISTFLIAVMSVYSVYEIGYIENDVITIKKEKNPTIRIRETEIRYIDNNYKKIISLKLLIIIALLSCLMILNTHFGLNLNIYPFILSLVLMRVLFYLHNFIRNNFNILTFFLLSVLKYFTVVLLYFSSEKSVHLLFFILLMFNIPRTLEHSTKIKYNVVFLQNAIGNHDVFRVKYYFTVLVSLLLLRLFIVYNSFYIFIICWFLAYRFFVLLALKFKFFERKK